MHAHALIDAFFAGLALAFVVVVWAMHPSIGPRRDKCEAASHEVGATRRGITTP